MKLVDILARELKVWPDQYYQIYQDSGGNLIGTLSNNDLEDCDSEDLPYDPVTIAWDGISAIVGRSEWQAAVDVLYPKQAVTEEWTGEGQPPVGIDVEIHNKPCRGVVEGAESFIGTNCKVLAVFANVNGYEMVAVEDTAGACMCFRVDMCGPVRTPEQIAAEERETELNRMVATVSMLDKGWARKVCAGLYDAGYRKFEIVDAKEEATHCFGLPISEIQKMAEG